MKTKITSQTSRAGLALVVISFLLSLVPFQGKNLATSKERTTAQTEVVVVADKKLRKRSISFSLFSHESPVVNHAPFQLAEVHSLEVKVTEKNLARSYIPVRRVQSLNTFFTSETEDHIVA